MLNNLHKFFQGKRKSLESFYLLYDMFNGVQLYHKIWVEPLLPLYLYEWIDILHDFFFVRGGFSEILRNTYGGGMPNAYYWLQGGSKIQKTCLRNTWMFPKEFLDPRKSFCAALETNRLFSLVFMTYDLFIHNRSFINQKVEVWIEL